MILHLFGFSNAINIIENINNYLRKKSFFFAKPIQKLLLLNFNNLHSFKICNVNF